MNALVERLAGVVIENRDALDVMTSLDTPDSLHYVDPPYVSETRYNGQNYKHEMTDQDHRAMADCLKSLQGMVILSGYDCDLYRELFGNWHRVERQAFADGARKRTECLWLNSRAIEKHQGCLFGGDA
jgi:DNA adenine methylase